MGVGPAYAIPKLLKKIGVSKDDIDFYEVLLFKLYQMAGILKTSN
jgi:acetyl-CoA acetyltransferase